MAAQGQLWSSVPILPILFALLLLATSPDPQPDTGHLLPDPFPLYLTPSRGNTSLNLSLGIATRAAVARHLPQPVFLTYHVAKVPAYHPLPWPRQGRCLLCPPLLSSSRNTGGSRCRRKSNWTHKPEKEGITKQLLLMADEKIQRNQPENYWK